jgi:predicted dehydrogenase
MTDALGVAPSSLRGAVVGYGFIAERGHVPAYAMPGRTRFEIAAVADPCAARRGKAAQAIPGAHIYESAEELLSRERGQLDFVDICAPPSEHARLARLALSQGLHVLCEKPLATRADDAQALTRLARTSRRVLFPSHNYKHAPVIRAVREALDAGLVGRVRLATLQTFRTTHARGVDEWRPHWRRDRRIAGGGIAMDHGSHTFYLAFDWFGEYPTAITAKMTTPADRDAIAAPRAFDTEDNFACSMTFPSGSATAHLSWTAGVRKVIYTLHGELGAIRVEDDDVEVVVRDDGAGASGGRDSYRVAARRQIASDWKDASHVGWFRSLFDDFAEAIVRSDFVSRDTEASARCVELISAAYASALDGCRERSLDGAAAIDAAGEL